MFTERNLWTDSTFPQQGVARCQILGQFRDRSGRELARITIAETDGLETRDGMSEIVVLESRIIG